MVQKTSSEKYKTWKKGLLAEEVAKWCLRMQGYRILEQRYKTPLGEIDLIIQRGKSLAFVEVKLRPTIQEALESVSYLQQKRIRQTADFYLRKGQAPDTVRFDVFLVKPYAFPVHIKNAF